MQGAGQRTRNRVRFERQVAGGDDGYGNTLPSTWTEIVTISGGFRPKFGREQLEAGRLESTMQGTLTVRRTPTTAAIDEAARAVFVAGPYNGKVCQIRSTVPTPDNRELELLLEEGAAT